jgi:hypothetical protein
MRARRSRVDYRRHALGDAIRVRRDTVGNDAIVNMNVEVNQAGSDDLSASVQNLLRIRLGNVLRDTSQLAAGNGYIALVGNSLGGVNYATASNQ